MKLGELRKPPGSTKKRKRVGRGPGSGHGKTSTRGHKGQKSRSGYKSKAYFEGGQMPLSRRLPKRGFRSPFKREFTIVNLDQLEALTGLERIDPETLQQRGIVRKIDLPIKILGGGEMKFAATVAANAFSQSARQKIEAAGGRVEVI
ncbi:MAG: 50S ribosomal protein L15 [candidate division Zixibacteria bacterium DG_27]|nr:MAG: 50S ribosomal protein L15 [candidate division Zixibacteria bacterium DG_27]